MGQVSKTQLSTKGTTLDTTFDCISRREAIDALENSGYCYDQFLGVESVLNALPSAQPEGKKGKWIYLDGVDVFECSVCGGRMVRNIFNYCPWCGVQMDERRTDV